MVCSVIADLISKIDLCKKLTLFWTNLRTVNREILACSVTYLMSNPEENLKFLDSIEF